MEGPTMSSSVLDGQAVALIQRMAQDSTKESGFGSMTSTIYDTAWVSMISKFVDGERKWLFPECFRVILDANLLEGSNGSYGSGILNALATLLALRIHYNAAQGKECHDLPVDIWSRMGKLVSFLEIKLRDWKVEECQHVGFEMLVPALLAMLEKEGIYFQFPGQKALFLIRDKKLANFDVRCLYGPELTTPIFSLEAFVGEIDFDRVSHHKRLGSVVGSPSSTAAYLINASTWDDEAEAYLRNVIANGHGSGSGGVPVAFPSTIAELAWTASTLLESGYSADTLGLKNVEKIADYLEAQLQTGKGIVGFAPSVPADADDCAKTLLTLRLLGRPTVPEQMIEAFEMTDHFRTYKSERHPSFSANCNVLNALLHQNEPHKYLDQLSKVTAFLCNTWWDGSIADKWNLSPHYSMMLLAQAFNHLLCLWDGDHLLGFPDSLLRHRIPVVMCQVLVRTLRSQISNGSWENSSEITSYAVLTLVSSAHLPWNKLLEPRINLVIQRGREFLSGSQKRWKLPEHIWISKVNYGLATHCEAYCLAAMKASTSLRYKWTDRMLNLTRVPAKSVIQMSQSLSKTPLLSNESGWKLNAAIIEGFLFLPQLRNARGDILRRNELKESRYFDYIVCTWTSIGYLDNSFIDPYFLWEMMRIALFSFEIDEYVESSIASRSVDDLDLVKQMINRLFRDYRSGVKPNSNGAEMNDVAYNNTLKDETECFSRAISYILTHPQVQKAHPSDQATLAQELQTYLLAQIDQSINNFRFFHQQKPCKANTGHTVALDHPPANYSTWVHTAAADYLSGPLAFAFVACLLSSQNGGKPCFLGVQEKYLAQDVCRHSSIVSRQLKDLGSITRDRDENNLNSVNFPEFHEGITLDEAVNSEKRKMRTENSLLQLAEYERELLNTAMARLEGMLATKTRKVLRWFVNVADLWGQIHVQGDVTDYVKKRN